MLKRMTALFAVICLLFSALLWRTMEAGRTAALTATRQSQTRTLTIGESRGVIYDRNLEGLAPSGKRLLAAVAPCAAAKAQMEAAFGAERAAAMLQSGAPCLAETQTWIQTEFIRTFYVPVRRDANALAQQLVGTVGSDKHGKTGVEKAFDALLCTNAGTLSVRFFADATGRVLPGLDKEILAHNYCSKAGVALTIDSAMQRIAENALRESSVQSGCAVITDAETGEIYAIANAPQDGEINCALHAYSVGSVLKPLLAAFALEQGVSKSFSYTCEGSCRIGDTSFQCYGKTAHGTQTMRKALENSCNTYFIRLMQEIDAGAFLSFCQTLGFGTPLKLCEGLACDGGSLPDERELLLPGERANFAFGQGKLLASPIQLISLYQLLATGKQTPPTVFFGTVNNAGTLQKETALTPVQRLSSPTVKTLRRLLTASAAAAGVTVDGAAGKTGTAQSGIFKNGTEICRTWFAGFFPADAPKYIVTVLNEDGVSGAKDCAPVFDAICAAIQAGN